MASRGTPQDYHILIELLRGFTTAFELGVKLGKFLVCLQIQKPLRVRVFEVLFLFCSFARTIYIYILRLLDVKTKLHNPERQFPFENVVNCRVSLRSGAGTRRTNHCE